MGTRNRGRWKVGLLGLVGALGLTVSAPAVADRADRADRGERPDRLVARTVSAPTPRTTPRPPARGLPGGRTRILAGRTLVAYYGTAGTGALGVLGEHDIDTTTRRLRAAAAPFSRPGRPAQIVYELIVTVADGHPGADGNYSHDIARAAVRPYLEAARRHGALVVLDLQPGRQDFLTAAKRWAWALRDPRVGLALDPEWRMGPGQVPARTIGRVGAAEVNRTSAWLAGLVRRHRLPHKLFVLHQFRTSMITDIGRIRPRVGLEEVQHVDGYGTPGQKLATFRAVQRPDLFALGFKLFYDEDVHRMSAARVLQIRPRVRFVTFQ